MKQSFYAGLVSAIVVVGGGAAYVALPSLQDDQRTVDADASRHALRAQRSLDQFSPMLDRGHQVTQRLIETDTVAELGTDEIKRLLESDSQVAAEAFGVQVDWINASAKPAQSRMNALDAEFVAMDPSAQPQPMAPWQPARNVNQMAGALTAGVHKMAAVAS